MRVWQLKRCEEYWMQEDHGLFATREAAEAAIKQPIIWSNVVDGTDLIVVTKDVNHYSNPRSVPSPERIEELAKPGFEFYDLDHNGYPVWGIFAVDVKE